MSYLWAITPEKVQTAIQKIIEISNPRKVILFGSYVRGKIHSNSDLDVLVVTGDEIENPRKESVRIRRALKGIVMSMDIGTWDVVQSIQITFPSPTSLLAL